MDLVDQIYRVICLRSVVVDRLIQSEFRDGLTDHRKVKSDYIWLTVNPREGDVAKFVSTCHSFARLKPIFAMIYVFEQRGEDVGDYHGVHMHALIKRNDKPYNMLKAIYRVFDSWVGNRQHIVATWVTLEQCRDKYRYMCGDKRDSKLSKVQNDPQFRAVYSLDPLYQVGDAHEITC